jgi:CheY-like chemotaxis protein
VVFTIRLPVAAVTRPPASDDHGRRAPAAPVSLTAVRVLVVDDELDARDLLRELLEGAGATVLAVESAAAALDAVTSWHPDIVVSDIGMPAKDGYTLVQEIRALTDPRARSVPAIALTAYTGVDDVARARRAGFQAHLAKPIDAADLLSAIVAVLHPNPAAA